MPIVNSTLATPVVELPHPIQVSSPIYRGVTVDTRYIPASALLTHIEGSSWSVNYYSQVLNVDNAVSGQSPGRSAVYQQYRLIKQLELKVTDPLAFEQNDTNKNVKMSGRATVYPFLIPNIGDIFLADIGDGREAVFQVTESDQKSIYTETCYSIAYESIDYSTAARRADLEAKTVESYQYLRDFMQYGQNPLLVSSDYAAYQNLTQNYYSTLTAWSAEFFSQEFSTWMIPGQTARCYDGFLTSAMAKWTTTTDTPEIRRVRVLNTDGDDQMDVPTIWDALLARDMQILRRVTEEVGLVPVEYFPYDAMLAGVRYSGVRYVVYPTNAIPTWDYGTARALPVVSATMSLIEVPARRGRLAELIPDVSLAGLPYEGLPLIKKVTTDDFYVFSAAFYTKDKANQSRLEAAVWDYLEGNAQNQSLLNTLLISYQSWGALERFYYTPIILMLVKATIRSI